jgi:copper(I)-binding protein
MTALATAALLVLAACGGGEGDQDAVKQTQQPELPDGELEVHEPWVRPAASGGNSALYLTLLNGTSSADTLVDVDAPIIDSIAVHRTTDSAGTSTMKPVGTTVAIPAKSRVTLEPGGQHVMLVNLQQTLEDGGTVILNLDFAQAGLRRIRAPIRTQPPTGG